MKSEAERRVERHWGLVELCTRYVARKYRFDPRWWPEMESAAGLALWRAAREYDGTSNERGYLFQKIEWAILDELRAVIGRKGSAKAEFRLFSIDVFTSEDESVWDSSSGCLPEPLRDNRSQQQIDYDHTLDDLLASLPNDRYREIAVRTAAGEDEPTIGAHLGVSAARVSQMLRLVKSRLADGRPEGEEKEVAWRPRGEEHSLVVSWM